MTTPAMHQFIAICGAAHLLKGCTFGEPRLTPREEGAYEDGMTEHIAFALNKREPGAPHNPHPRGTLEAEHWAKGRFIELQQERWMVDAYTSATRYMVLP